MSHDELAKKHDDLFEQIQTALDAGDLQKANELNEKLKEVHNEMFEYTKVEVKK